MLMGIKPLALAGVALHWLKPKEKRPVSENWSELPVASWAKLERTYRDGLNVGIRLGEPSKIAGKFLHAIDLDIRTPEAAAEAHAWLTDNLPGWRKLPFVRSGSGGSSRHVYFLTDRPFRSRKLAQSDGFFKDSDGKKHRNWEIELFGTGKQVACPPSVHPSGGVYAWGRPLDLEMIEMDCGPVVSSSLVDELIGYQDRSIADKEGTDPLGMDLSEAEEKIAQLDQGDWCEDRDGWVKVGMGLHHEFDGSSEAFEAWCRWSAQSEKFNRQDSKAVWRSFRGEKSKASVATMRTILHAVNGANWQETSDDEIENLDEDEESEENEDESDVEDLGEPEKQEKSSKNDEKPKKIPKLVADLNKQIAIANIKGKVVVLYKNEDGTVDFGSVEGLKQLYSNQRYATENGSAPIISKWLNHTGRDTYHKGVEFQPNPKYTNHRAYNLWRGFAVVPNSNRSCDRIIDHIKNVICNGNKAHWTYLINWLAHMVQRPWEKPGVAVVLRGEKGAGKDTLGDYITGLFPAHYTKVANPEHFLGKFNPHLQQCVFLHVEEALWAGDRRADGILKNLVTSPTLQIEPKGVNPFPVRSYLRIFMSSNEDWVVPATKGERRYFVLDVPSTKKRKSRYFQAIVDERDNGGVGALLHYLQSVDLSDFDIRNVPQTEALADQKVVGLRNIEKWWFNLLAEGEFPDDCDFPGGEQWAAGWVEIDKSDLLKNYEEAIRKLRWEGDPMSRESFGKMLHKLTGGKIKEKKLRVKNKPYQRLYQIPNLEDCRVAFDKIYGTNLSSQNEGKIEVSEEDMDDLD